MMKAWYIKIWAEIFKLRKMSDKNKPYDSSKPLNKKFFLPLLFFLYISLLFLTLTDYDEGAFAATSLLPTLPIRIDVVSQYFKRKNIISSHRICCRRPLFSDVIICVLCQVLK